MKGLARLLVFHALVVALGVVGLVGCAGAALPAGLVGRWRGGMHSNGPWYYEFSADGHYRTWPARSPGAQNTGTVAADGDTLTFSNAGAPVSATWSLAGDVLVLDGGRYVRA